VLGINRANGLSDETVLVLSKWDEIVAIRLAVQEQLFRV
jgi:hypothetical protein